MKLRLLYSIILFLVYVCNLSAVSVETGVSRDLATRRKASVSNIRYRLDLGIDSVRTKKPSGRIEIEFDYKPDGDPLRLDFEGEAVSEVVINGKLEKFPEWKSGHLILNPGSLNEGRNRIKAAFTPADRALNRNPDYMYTLFVPFRAHSVFPCFDQPDMKATYSLTLTVPETWKAVSNSPVISEKKSPDKTRKTIAFGPTEPLSTYLFAFAAGEFEYDNFVKDGRTIGAYHREKDPERVAQLEEIFNQVFNSLEILEDYTGIAYPFEKYDLVILPGFQFGGMEHTGATFYNDRQLFLSGNATGADLLRRATVIAHETAHMWFGDYVTMEWFDEVWTKEVFANYFAALLSRELLPEYDHDLEWLRVYMSSALDQDRSEGRTPILQQLDNMENAGLIYNNIIYNKSPLILGKLVELAGDENFKRSIRKYLSGHAYSNATWADFLSALADNSPMPIEEFSRVWVTEAGMPRLSFEIEKDTLIINEADIAGHDILRPQTFDVIVGDKDYSEEFTVSLNGLRKLSAIPLKQTVGNPLIIPSADGRAYGLLTIPGEMTTRLMKDYSDPTGVCSRLSPAGRLATLIMLNENYQARRISTPEWLSFLIEALAKASDTQMLSALSRYLGPTLLDLPSEEAESYELDLLTLSSTHPSDQGRLLILRGILPFLRSSASADTLFQLWDSGGNGSLSEDDIADIALYLSILRPAEAETIISRQRERITSSDRLRKFDYISRGAVNDPSVRDNLFESLSDPANRLVEPWTLSLLSLLNHPVRHPHSINYILPGLGLLPEIQKTGDIFFPANWASVLLSTYRSAEAAEAVRRFLKENSDMNPLLLNKVRQSASRLIAPR